MEQCDYVHESGVRCHLESPHDDRDHDCCIHNAPEGKPYDDPLSDCTDFAHPAWWRAHYHTSDQWAKTVTKWLDGEDSGKGVMGEPWQTIRERIRALVHLDAGLSLDTLSPDQRMQLFAKYCTHCGTDNPKCQCWNDE